MVGFDNIPEAAYFYPSVTTIYQDLQLLGELAARNIVKMIPARQRNQLVIAQSISVQPTLLIRESSQHV